MVEKLLQDYDRAYGLQDLEMKNSTQVFNLGNGNRFSVQQIIDAARKVTKKPIKAIECDRIQGNPPILIGSSAKAQRILGWQLQYSDLETIVAHAWQRHQLRHKLSPEG